MTSRSTTGARTQKREDGDSSGYFEFSRRPLQILIFLLPLIVSYELGLILLLRSEQGTLTIQAHRSIVNFLDAFGVLPAGLYLGGAAIVAVLLAWHVLIGQSWRVDVKVACLMAAESAVLAMPLVAAGQFIAHAVPAVSPALAGPPVDPTTMQLPAVQAVIISFGAGLYEELLFRMILIAILHTLLVDVCRATHGVGAAIAITVSAVAFTVYHRFIFTETGVDWPSFLFLLFAGLYFGALYVIRGFGIVVGAHASYDILALWLLPALFAPSA